MGSVFSGLEDRLSAEIDAVFGELFVFFPMAQPTVNSRLGPDPARVSFSFTAVIDDRNPGSNSFERLGGSGAGATSSGTKPAFSASSPMLFFEGDRFGDATPPRRLDRVQRIGTGATYEITALEKDGQGRYKAGLVKVA